MITFDDEPRGGTEEPSWTVALQGGEVERIVHHSK